MNRIAKTAAIAVSSVALAACLGGCAQSPLSEKAPEDIFEYVPEYSTQHVFLPIHLDEKISVGDYSITFDTAGWTQMYLPPSLNNEALNYYFKGRFENKSSDVYRLSASTEATITVNGGYHLKGNVVAIDYGVVRDDPNIYPGETVDFIIRTPLPKSMRDTFETAVVTFTLHSAGTENGVYTIHGSATLGEYILGVNKEGCM